MVCTLSGETYSKLICLMRANLSKTRRNHSFETARLAHELCRHYQIQPYKGVLAGLVHDLAREMDHTDLFDLAGRDGKDFSVSERENPVLVHGRAAAVLLEEELQVHDKEIIQAVSDHVTGRPGMGMLSRILFVADLLEPGRRFLTSRFRRFTLQQSLDRMVLIVLKCIFTHLKKEHKSIAKPAKELYQELIRNGCD